MSFSNVNCEEKNESDERSLPKDYFSEKLEGNNKIQIDSEITCERGDVNNPNNQITVATLINQTQIQDRRIYDEKADITNKSLKGKSFSTPRKPLRFALIERRLRTRKKSKILKNPTRRQIPARRKAAGNVKTKLKNKDNDLHEREEGERKSSEERVCVERSEEMPKRGKRGLVGGKAKANPPKEDSNCSHDSDEDSDSFHFYRISLGYFQKFRNVQGASTSTRHEITLDKTPPSFKTPRLEARNSEERELLELQRWGMASLITDDNVIVEMDKLEVNTNSSEDFERDETNLKASCDFTVNNSLCQDLNKPLVDVRKMERDTEFIRSAVKPKLYPQSENLVIGNVNYKWIQTRDSISVEMKCPLYVISSNQISVKTTSFSLEINIKSSNESEWTPFFNCTLAGRISPEGSTWCLGPSPSILVYLKKDTNDFWESFIKSPAESPDIVLDGSQTDLDEIYQPDVLDIIKNLSLIEINKAFIKDPISNYKNKPEACTTELRDVMESGEEFKGAEKFD